VKRSGEGDFPQAVLWETPLTPTLSPQAVRGKSPFIAFAIQPNLIMLYRPIFTLVQRRLMMRWLAGSRAVMTNSFESVASSG
jgi:hypothetical protein